MRLSTALMFGTSFLALAAPVAAQNAEQAEAQQVQDAVSPEPAAPAAAVAEDNEIVVTGTRRSDRTVTNSASPIDVISSAELDTQPTANMLDAIKNIVPSFYVPQNTISDASTFVRAPSLRGLPSDQMLVQINGKRFNRSALVQVYTGGDTGLAFGSQGPDISAIPSIAIKSLQILRDGATAQYGSDAIAGVMNFGMRNDRNAIEIEGRYGQFFDHGSTKLDSGIQRQLAGMVGVPIGATGFIDVAGEWYRDDGTSRGETRPVAVLFAQEFPALAPQLPHYPLPVQIWGSSPQKGWKSMANAGVDVTANSQIYVTGIAARNKGNQSFNYRSPITRTAVDEQGNVRTLRANGAFRNPYYLTPCPTGNPTCPAGGFVNDSNVFLFSSIYPAGFTPRFVGDSKERWGTAGWRGKFDNGLTWDISGTAAKNTLALSMYNSLSPTYGPLSQTSFDFGVLSQKERNLNLDLTYPLNVGLFSPLTLAGGLEYRKETYGQTQGDEQSYGVGPYVVQNVYIETAPGVFTFDRTISGRGPGASGYGGTSPKYAGSWSQHNWGVYGAAEGDITEALSMGVAGRYEDYNTFGGSFVWKVNGIFKATPQVSLRATVGTGFHAPSPGQAHNAILTTNFVAGQAVQTGTFPVDSPISQFYGATTLKPEKSRNYGAGVVLKPLPNLTFTIDGYIINVRGRIGVSRTFSVTAADIIALPELATVGEGSDINFFTNATNTSTKGVDLVGTWRTGLLGGRLTTTLAYNYNKSKVTKFDPDVISSQQRINVAHLAPNHRAVLSGNFTTGPWTVNARENYYGWWTNAADYPVAYDSAGNITAGQRFGAKLTTDVDISYTFREMLTLTLGATNLFNTYPTKVRHSADNPIFPLTGSTADGQVYPRTGGPFGMNGGMWWVRLAAKLRPFAQTAAYVPAPAPPPPPPPVMEPAPLPPPPAPAPVTGGERGN